MSCEICGAQSVSRKKQKMKKNLELKIVRFVVFNLGLPRTKFLQLKIVNFAVFKLGLPRKKIWSSKL